MLQNFALPFRHRQRAAQPLRRLAGAQVEPHLDQPPAVSRRWNLSVCRCRAPGADAICARGAKVVKGVVRGMLQNFALPFRDRQWAQPLMGLAGAQLESLWRQPAAIGGRVPRRRLWELALTFRHRRQAVQPLRCRRAHRWILDGTSKQYREDVVWYVAYVARLAQTRFVHGPRTR